jgi:hypothetical protein
MWWENWIGQGVKGGVFQGLMTLKPAASKGLVALAARTCKAHCMSSVKLRTVIDDMRHPCEIYLNDVIPAIMKSFFGAHDPGGKNAIDELWQNCGCVRGCSWQVA